jgi:hypothetical protein
MLSPTLVLISPSCGSARLILRRCSIFCAGAVAVAAAAALLLPYLSASPRPPSLPLTHTHHPLHHPHPQTATLFAAHLATLVILSSHPLPYSPTSHSTTGLYPKHTLRDTSCLTAADTVAAAAATLVAAAAAVEDTAAGTTPRRIADTARRTTIPMGMPYGLCALIAPF